jgi:hypothetical protein
MVVARAWLAATGDAPSLADQAPVDDPIAVQ